MSELLGNSLTVYVGFTCILAGGTAWMMGQAIGGSWRPAWQVVAYGLLLGASDRFLIFALFQGELLLPSGYLIDTATLIVIALTAHRVTLVAAMVKQYPWLYERAGPFAWRRRGGGTPGESAT